MQLSTGMSAVYVKIKKKELTQFYSIQHLQQENMQSSLRYILTLLVLSVNIFCGKYLMLVFKLKIICSESMKYTVLVLVHSHDEFKGDTCKKRRSENAGQLNQ